MEMSAISPVVRIPSRAAQYVRMSTEHQQYSPQNQVDVIQQYAADHNMEIVGVYSDHGRSGLNIAGREGLNQLMSDVEAKRTNFSSLLVYDVSRWGRFQDVDESAYYEYVLKRAGIRVHYCAEQFENDGSMSSSVLKTLKRSMAAEYRAARRVLPMTSAVYELLAARHEAQGHPKTGWVFPTGTNCGHIETQRAKRHHATAIKASGVERFVPYILRYMALTHLAKAAGGDVFALAKIAGHSSIVISQQYVHPEAETIDEVFARLSAGRAHREPGVGTNLGTAPIHPVATLP